MLNTFPITEVRRPPYFYSRAQDFDLSIALLSPIGRIHSYITSSIIDKFRPILIPINNDELITGNATGSKATYYIVNSQIYSNTTGSWSSNNEADGAGGGFSKINNKFYILNNSLTELTSSANMIEYSYSEQFKTGSSESRSLFLPVSPVIRFFNSTTSTYSRGKILIGSQAVGPAGGFIGVFEPENTASYYYQCSASAAALRVASPAYNHRKNQLWSATENKKLICHDFDTGQIVESRSWNYISTSSVGFTPEITNVIYMTQLNQLWLSNGVLVEIYDLTTNKSSSIFSSDLFNGTNARPYSIAVGGGVEKIQ